MTGFADRRQPPSDAPAAANAAMRSGGAAPTILHADAHHRRQLRSMSLWAVPLSVAIWAALIALVR